MHVFALQMYIKKPLKQNKKGIIMCKKAKKQNYLHKKQEV